MKIKVAHPEFGIQDNMRNYSQLKCSEVAREPIMNRYWHDIIDIDTKRNQK
jgi:hypothetical protein